ncbi:STAS domain-containing protein [Sphaerisporangium sp. NPDC049003]
MSVHLVHRHADTALVTLTGEVDASNCDRLETALRRLVAGGVLHILVNAGELRFCDLAGARVLARTHADLRGYGGKLVIAASPNVAKLLGLLWSPQDPGFPQIITREWIEREAGPPQVLYRHVQVYRRLGRECSTRAGAGARASLTRTDAAVPAVDTATGPGPAAQAGPASRLSMRSVLERSARLRQETERRLETLHAQVQVACATLAEVHERLADSHAVMAGAVRVSGDTACDDHSHHARAEQIRRRAVVFAGERPVAPGA